MPRHPPCALFSLTLRHLYLYKQLRFQSCFESLLGSLDFWQSARLVANVLPAASLFFFSLFSSQGTPLRGALRVLIPRLPRSFLRASLLTAFSPLLPFRGLSSNVPIALKRVLPGAAGGGLNVSSSPLEPLGSRFLSVPILPGFLPFREVGGLKWTRTTDLTLIRRAL